MERLSIVAEFAMGETEKYHLWWCRERWRRLSLITKNQYFLNCRGGPGHILIEVLSQCGPSKMCYVRSPCGRMRRNNFLPCKYDPDRGQGRPVWTEVRSVLRTNCWLVANQDALGSSFRRVAALSWNQRQGPRTKQVYWRGYRDKWSKVV